MQVVANTPLLETKAKPLPAIIRVNFFLLNNLLITTEEGR